MRAFVNSRTAVAAAAIAAAAAFGGAAAPAHAASSIALVIDGSGSISSGDFTLQKQGYINALNALLTPDTFGQNAFTVVQFSGTAQTEFNLAVIDDAGDVAALTAAINGMVQIGGQTAIGQGIQLGADNIVAGGFGDRWIIDVSTDGENNVPPAPDGVAEDVVNNDGIDQVNCLGVGGGADCSFIFGTGSFSIQADNFAEFEEAITTKLSREISPVPEPASIAILVTGLLGAGILARRRRS